MRLEKREIIKYSDISLNLKMRTRKEVHEMGKEREKAKKFVDLAQGNMARKRTATEGSFKHGGLVKLRSGKPKLAKKGWR
jgi:hypothetical protein